MASPPRELNLAIYIYISSTHTCMFNPVMPTPATIHLRARAMQLRLLPHHLPHATILQCQDLTILLCTTTKLVDYAGKHIPSPAYQAPLIHLGISPLLHVPQAQCLASNPKVLHLPHLVSLLQLARRPSSCCILFYALLSDDAADNLLSGTAKWSIRW